MTSKQRKACRLHSRLCSFGWYFRVEINQQGNNQLQIMNDCGQKLSFPDEMRLREFRQEIIDIVR
jgi:hypothetical protein